MDVACSSVTLRIRVNHIGREGKGKEGKGKEGKGKEIVGFVRFTWRWLNVRIDNLVLGFKKSIDFNRQFLEHLDELKRTPFDANVQNQGHFVAISHNGNPGEQ